MHIGMTNPKTSQIQIPTGIKVDTFRDAYLQKNINHFSYERHLREIQRGVQHLTVPKIIDNAYIPYVRKHIQLQVSKLGKEPW